MDPEILILQSLCIVPCAACVHLSGGPGEGSKAPWLTSWSKTMFWQQLAFWWGMFLNA